MENLKNKLNLIKNSIITIPNYPKEGILFRDITGLLENHYAFKATIDLFIERYRYQKIDKIVGTEARGFIFAAPLALELNAGFVPVRKPKKLPRAAFSETYQLEYNTDTLELHMDAIKKGEHVLIVDDLLATGGTVVATTNLIRKAGGIVKDAAFVINLPDLGGEEKLNKQNITCFSLINFSGH